MKRAWNWLALFCAAGNAIWVGVAWYNGDPVWWFVWASSIAFSIDVGLNCIRDLLEPA